MGTWREGALGAVTGNISTVVRTAAFREKSQSEDLNGFKVPSTLDQSQEGLRKCQQWGLRDGSVDTQWEGEGCLRTVNSYALTHMDTHSLLHNNNQSQVLNCQ